jgi:pimeloyl-ACP methyl ester carboxylesterase
MVCNDEGTDEMSDLQSRLIEIPFRGFNLSVSCFVRPGNGEPILYFHGLGGSKEDFLGAWSVPEWTGRTIVAFDAPGCGATRGYRPGIPLGVDDIVSVAMELSDRLGLLPATVIGHSLGGAAALLLAIRQPERVRRLVSVEGNLAPEDCAFYSRRVFLECFLGDEEGFMKRLLEPLARSCETGERRAAAKLRRNVEDAAFFDYCRSLVGYCDHAPLLQDFLQLGIPRLYVRGDCSPRGTVGQTLERAGVPVGTIPASGHFPFWSNESAYWDTLRGFCMKGERDGSELSGERDGPGAGHNERSRPRLPGANQ